MAGAQDAWRVTGDDRAKHDQQFFQLKPVNGYVTGNQARDFFMQSGLPTPVLGQIWGLADMNNDGKMDKKEFSIAMHLIKKKLQGYELPKSLPASLKADPTPVIGSFAQPMGGQMPQQMNMGFQMGGMPQAMAPMAPMMGGMSMAPMIQPQASLGTATMTTGSLGVGPRMANGAAAAPSGVVPDASPGTGFWSMPHNVKLKHTQTFNANDRNKRGYLLGVEARSILMQSGLPQPYLAQIWTLADIDRDGKLTCDEFCIAMHLSEHARMGHALPATLPAELIPAKTRSGSITSPPPSSGPATPQKAAFGDLLSNAGMPPPMPPPAPVEEVAPTIDEQVTFEDKRKENFDKGQAELERRRALLREQQQKEENERLEKERQAAEKRERQRLEQEQKRQAELQKQLERQREKEQQIEEQRRKMQEQREAARREMERQRQMEWEKTRKEQLMAEKQREYEHLSILKSQMANMKNELESMDAKKAELALKIQQVQKSVTDFTSGIDAMRVSRDRTLADIDMFDKQSTELNRKLANLGSEKEALNVQVQTAQATPLSDTHKTVLNSVEIKRTNIQKLKKEVEQMESDTEARLGEIDCNNAELKNLKQQLASLERDLPKLQKLHQERDAQQKKTTQELQQRQERLKQDTSQQKTATAATNGQSSWFDFDSSEAVQSSAGTGSAINWDSAFTSTQNSAAYSNIEVSGSAWGASNGATGGGSEGAKEKYRALYDFTASRDDELSLVAGMDVYVLVGYSPVPGMEDWYKGESNGSIGWFPKAYVERQEEPSTDLFGSAFDPVVQSSVANSQFSQDLFGSSTVEASTVPSSAIADANSGDTKLGGPGSEATHIPAEGLLAKAIYPWKARQETDLTFDKDETILVKEQQDMKWFGEVNGKSGWFPKAYVKLIGVASKADATAADTSNQSQTSSAQPSMQGEYYIAMYTYASDEPSDLTFSEGDMIYVTTTSGDWWTGTITDQGKSGIFPANYVKKLDIQPNLAPPQVADGSAFASTSDAFGDMFSSPTASLSEAGTMKALDFNTIMESAVGLSPTPSSDNTDAQSKKALGFDEIMQGALLDNSTPMARPNSTPAILESGLEEDPFGGLGSLTGSSSMTSTDPFGQLLSPASTGDAFGGDDPFGNLDPFSNKDSTVDTAFGGDNLLDWGSSSAAAKPMELNLPVPGSSVTDLSMIEMDATLNSPMTPHSLLDGMSGENATARDMSVSDLDDFGLNFGGPPESTPPPKPSFSMGGVELDLLGFGSSSPNNSSSMGSLLDFDGLDDLSTKKKSKAAPPRPPQPPKKKDSQPEQKTLTLKKPEIARVIAPYTATGTGQLSLETGNLINVRQKSPRGWWEGELQARGQKKKIGWFPANYVKLLGSSSARSTPEPTGANLAIGNQGSRSTTPQSIASQEGVFGTNQAETVVALYAYTAQNDDELTFQKDAVITVLSRDNPGWWSGQLDGQTGVFPSNYVTPSPHASSWMNDTEGELTRMEKKRQQAIQELITTEETYYTDMQIALEVFKRPLVESKIIPLEHVNQIFVNWEELIVCNKKLLQALRVRKKMCGRNGVIVSIGDILCESLPHMDPYMRFCSCQLSAAATLQRVSETIPAFHEFHKNCMTNPKVKGVHLSGFMLKPMQRITRYPLLIEKILDSTPANHADRAILEEALTQAQELCTQANQCVKEKQNSDSLEWIQANVQCDGLAENIVFNSRTNCLGPRRLLYHGLLYKAKSSKELMGFLFNDFLMLAQTSKPLGTSYSTMHLFDTSIQFKMYRLPYFLNEIQVKKSADEAEPTLFHITSDRIITFKAVSAVERDTWVRKIDAASKHYKDKAMKKLERAHSALRAKPIGRVLVVIEEGVGLKASADAVKHPSVGRIVVVVQEACLLKASDASGKSDPYCEVSMGSQEHRTKVIPGTLNPKWNASMQFHIRDVEQDTLCFTVYDRDLYSPNDFLGRTEVNIKDVLAQSGERRGPITKRLILHEVETGEVVVKLDLLLYEPS